MATRTRQRRRLRVVVAAACALLTACGSQVPPSEMIYGNNGAGGGAGPAAAGTAGAAGNGGAAAPAGAANGPALTGSGTAANAPGAGAPAAGGTGPSGRTAGTAAAGPTRAANGGSSGGGANSAPGAIVIPAASCAGFANSTGITDSTITIANASDVSGPVPGLFKSAQQAVQAYAAYFNSTSSICGRKLSVKNLDSATNEGGDQQAATTACSSAFAMVGSMSAFDGGGAATVGQCGIPDLRAASTETARYKSPVSFGAYSLAVPEIPLAPFQWFKSKFGDAYQHAAYLYLNAGASSLNAGSFQQGEKSIGYNFVYTQGIDVTTFNYGPYVQSMMDKGVKYVQYTGAYQNAVRLKQAMAAQNFNPIFVMDAVGYDQGFVQSGGSVANGTYLFLAGPMFEESGQNPQLQRYLQWLQRTSPGATPSFFGIFAWGAAELFTQLAIQLGGKLNRQTLLTAIRGVHNYTDGNMFNPQDPGGKHTGKCQSVVQLQNGKWVRITPFPYTCGSVAVTGVGS